MAKVVELVSKTGEKGTPDYKETKYNFTDPENVAEALSMWGEETVFKYIITAAHTKSINDKRNELKGKEPGVVAMGRSVADRIREAKEKGDLETLKAIEAILGMPVADK